MSGPAVSTKLAGLHGGLQSPMILGHSQSQKPVFHMGDKMMLRGRNKSAVVGLVALVLWGLSMNLGCSLANPVRTVEPMPVEVTTVQDVYETGPVEARMRHVPERGRTVLEFYEERQCREREAFVDREKVQQSTNILLLIADFTGAALVLTSGALIAESEWESTTVDETSQIVGPLLIVGSLLWTGGAVLGTVIHPDTRINRDYQPASDWVKTDCEPGRLNFFDVYFYAGDEKVYEGVLWGDGELVVSDDAFRDQGGRIGRGQTLRVVLEELYPEADEKPRRLETSIVFD